MKSEAHSEEARVQVDTDDEIEYNDDAVVQSDDYEQKPVVTQGDEHDEDDEIEEIEELPTPTV